MCSPTRCRKCGKTTWKGCGSHVAQVKATVPASQWCDGHHEAAADAASPGMFARMFGRGR
ncbi:hypothetical protein FO059_01180 [Tomitella fengzijianii]|uniref:Uncharacterized protein n=1 Tax=Tomitella fengzijianii TaxID=2597660 RepID=A0A516WZH7_9ACTN|nr:hypothetical protein FO059_01180 [Tomitella fengzijianii]